MPKPTKTPEHPEFAELATSYELTLRADGYAENTVLAYDRAVAQLAGWLLVHHPGVGPGGVTRDHVRAWLVDVRDTRSSSSARSWFAGVKHFYRWMVAEGECDTDPTVGIRTPRASEPTTPMVTREQIKALLASCAGNDFAARRDAAIIFVMVDTGLRIAEVGGLLLDSVDIRDRVLFVEGKGTNRSGPRRRAVPLGVAAARAVDRYLRARRSHPFASRDELWLGTRGHSHLGADGCDAMLKRRARDAGITGLHPHMLRHTWASEFRTAGGQEGDLMYLGGWRSRQMLDRYGKVAAGERAKEAGRRLSFGDSL